jgi:hypothetical protein
MRLIKSAQVAITLRPTLSDFGHRAPRGRPTMTACESERAQEHERALAAAQSDLRNIEPTNAHILCETLRLAQSNQFGSNVIRVKAVTSNLPNEFETTASFRPKSPRLAEER